jgi:hypothetical protein
MSECYTWRPQRPWHWHALIRTATSVFGVFVQTAILGRVFGAW